MRFEEALKLLRQGKCIHFPTADTYIFLKGIDIVCRDKKYDKKNKNLIKNSDLLYQDDNEKQTTIDFIFITEIMSDLWEEYKE